MNDYTTSTVKHSTFSLKGLYLSTIATSKYIFEIPLTYILDTSIRAVVALMSSVNMHLEQMDVKTSFLHSNIYR